MHYRRKNRDMNAIVERPFTILESIEESFKQIKEFKEGKRQLKTVDESFTEWEKWAKEVEDESK